VSEAEGGAAADAAGAALGARPPTALGELIGRTFRLTWRGLPAFLAVGLVAWTLAKAAAWALGKPDWLGQAVPGAIHPRESMAWFTWRHYVALKAIQEFLACLEMGAVAAGVASLLAGRRLTAAGMLAPVARAAGPLAGLAAILVLESLVKVKAPSLALVERPLELILFGLRLILSLTVPVILAEGAWPIQAFRRSAQLTRGRRWQLLGLYVATGLPLVLHGLPLRMEPPWGLLAGLAKDVLLQVAITVSVPVAYDALRGESESPDTSRLGEVFE